MKSDYQSRNGYILRCSNKTQPECFELMLFGENDQYETIIKQIKFGDPVFLYNVVTTRLYGLFIATSTGQKDIVPTAWNGKFPWQVKVEQKVLYNPIKRIDFYKEVPFNGRKPKSALLTPEQVKTLEGLLAHALPLPTTNEEFQAKFPKTHRSLDLHEQRSQQEVKIDDWLFWHGIAHTPEIQLPMKEEQYCDFSIPIPGSKEFIYIEYFGMKSKEYLSSAKEKIALYKKYNLNLVQLWPEDINRLDQTMTEHLIPYLLTQNK